MPPEFASPALSCSSARRAQAPLLLEAAKIGAEAGNFLDIMLSREIVSSEDPLVGDRNARGAANRCSVVSSVSTCGMARV